MDNTVFMMAPKIEQLLKKRYLKAAEVPYPERCWRILERLGFVDQVLNDYDPYSLDDLIDDAKAITEELIEENQRDVLQDAGRAGMLFGTVGDDRVLTTADEISAYERERSLVTSLFFALDAAKRKKVKDFRERVLGGTLLSPGEADRLMASPATALISHSLLEKAGIPLMHHTAEVVARDQWTSERGVRHYNASVLVSSPGVKLFPVHWQGGLRTLHYIDKDGSTQSVETLRSSLLGALLKVSEWLVGRYPWQDAEATRFVLTGEIPEVPPITGWLETGVDATITLTVRTYVSPKTVGQFYRYVQGHAENSRNKQETAKGVAVLRFVIEQTSGEDLTGRWPELQELWNDTHPAEWRYKDRGGLRKAYHRAYRHIIEPMQ